MSPVSLPELVRVRALEDPDRSVLRDVGRRGLTFADLAALGDAWGSLLRTVGLGRGDPVVTMLPNDSVGQLGWLGASWIGAVEIPMNHAFPVDWLQRLTDDVGAATAVVGAQFAGLWTPLLCSGTLSTLIVITDQNHAEVWHANGEQQSRSLSPTGLPPVSADRYDVSCVILTSGTTGPSKGVVIPWGQWESRSLSATIPHRFRDPDSVFYDPLPCCHTGGRVYFYDAVRQRSAVVTRDRFSTSSWLADIRREGCTGTVLIGATASFIHRSPVRADDGDNPLRYVNMAPVPSWIDEFTTRFDVEVMTSFSATEYGYPIIAGDNFVVNSASAGSCGMAAPGYDVRLVGEDGSDVAVDQPGELVVRGAPWTNSLGYWRRPDESMHAWRGGWFHTGDILRRDADGRFYFVDRVKDMIRRRGENISSFEVESAAIAHPDVKAAAAYSVASPHGEDDVMLAVEPRSGARLDPESVHRFLTTRLPSFAVPSFIEIHPRLPRTNTAKIRKAELRTAGVTPGAWRPPADRAAHR